MRLSSLSMCTRLTLAMALCSVTFLSSLSGCGSSKYEERLNRTVKFYDYLKSIESNLGQPWVRQDQGMSMRLPLPFQRPLPPPEIKKDQLGTEIPVVDPRQQTPLGIALPGLVEAWETTQDTSKTGPDTWIYILSNSSRFVDDSEQGRPAAEFMADLEQELMNAFQVTIPDGEVSQAKDNTRYRYQYPLPNSPAAQYTSPKDSTVIRFVPELPIQDRELHAILCERRVDQVQAACLIIYPKDSTMQFLQRVDMALATWNVENVVPRKPGGKPGTPGGNPSSGRPSQAAPNF
ncbi:hypothetical protein [Planctomicrobium sp. SH527]|uniref:hypothetical protein n=1 Tax=Planctomicrobium sp. SH527 TaxID=3448123 RepID=UPI003F5B71C3